MEGCSACRPQDDHPWSLEACGSCGACIRHWKSQNEVSLTGLCLGPKERLFLHHLETSFQCCFLSQRCKCQGELSEEDLQRRGHPGRPRGGSAETCEGCGKPSFVGLSYPLTMTWTYSLTSAVLLLPRREGSSTRPWLLLLPGCLGLALSPTKDIVPLCGPL